MFSSMASFSCLALLALISQANAQTWSDCNPMNTTHPCADNLALGTNYTVDFTSQLDKSVWNHTNGFITPTANGSEFTINARKQSPTIQSKFYIFFGSVEIHMKAASGTGIISSIVIQSDDLDEIDWEWMGGNHTHVQSNYFGKGNQTSFDRAVYHPISSPMDDFHNYTTHWTSEKIEWIVDGQVLRTLNYADANGGYNFPQTPSTVRLGNWAGGDPDNPKGTIEWAGGETDFKGGPYTMVVKSAKITDYGTGQAYHWSDTSGSFASIKSIAGNSTVAQTVNAPPAAPSQTVAEKWSSLSSGTKTGIYAGAGAGAAAFAALIAFCCVRQRRRGQADRATEEERQQEQRRGEAAYSGLSGRDQDRLPINATPGQPEMSTTGAYPRSIIDDDVGSINQYDPAGHDQRPTTPSVAPPAPIYHNAGFGSRGYTPSNSAQSTSPVVSNHGNNGGYSDIRTASPGYGNNMAPHNSGFDFGTGAAAPSRSFSERQPAGYGAVPLASPGYGNDGHHGGFAQGGYGGQQGGFQQQRSFSASPQMGMGMQQQQYQGYPASQNRF